TGRHINLLASAKPFEYRHCSQADILTERRLRKTLSYHRRECSLCLYLKHSIWHHFRWPCQGLCQISSDIHSLPNIGNVGQLHLALLSLLVALIAFLGGRANAN